jgi:hypothetical protein
VLRLTARLRRGTAVPAPPPAWPARKVASWILTRPADLADDNRAALTQITGRCEEPKETGTLVREFADMIGYTLPELRRLLISLV